MGSLYETAAVRPRVTLVSSKTVTVDSVTVWLWRGEGLLAALVVCRSLVLAAGDVGACMVYLAYRVPHM